MTNMIDFIGRLHTMVLHLPIGIFILAFILQYLIPRKITIHEQLLSLVMTMGFTTAVISWVLGWVLSLSGDYAANAIEWHKWSALFFVLLSGTLTFLQLSRKKLEWPKKIYHAAFGLTMMTMLMAGHFGGELTHGEGFLTNEMKGVKSAAVSGDNDQKEIATAGVKNNEFPVLPAIKPADAAVIESIRKSGFVIRPVSMETGFLEVSSINIPTLNDTMIASLKPLMNNVLWIRLSGERVTDEGLSILVQMKHLRRIDIRNTNASDRLLASLKSLDQLEYINLVGTKISEGGIKELIACKKIKNIYCWNTNVTSSFIDSIQKNRPDVRIVSGQVNQP